jgi:hypothetical protein
MKQIFQVERKPFMFVLEYLSKVLDRKGWGVGRVTPPPHPQSPNSTSPLIRGCFFKDEVTIIFSSSMFFFMHKCTKMTWE